MLLSAASFAAKRENPRMLTSKPTFAALLLFGGLALSAILLAADLKFLGVMVGVIAVPAAFTVLISGKEEKYY
jgi:formate hydrogenlyase subunit 3/multisubunit Na+/H+ antiporter MnhD subunit